jgi:predicted DNA binding CopG/RHH family protein
MEMHNGLENEISEEDFDKEFRRAKKVRVKRERKDSIISMRINETLLRRLSDYAHKNDMSMSAAARHLLDEGLKLHEDEENALAELLLNAANRLRHQDH